MRKLLFSLAVLVAFTTCAQAQQTPTIPSDQNDKYLWLEEPTSDRALAWVKAENDRSTKVLEADPRFAAYQADALKIAEDPNRLPFPDLRGGQVYNFWRDATHVHGILRRTTVADYLTEKPTWNTVLDIDALGQQENVKWVMHGLTCEYPNDKFCLVTLSAGGEDASTERRVRPHSRQVCR